MYIFLSFKDYQFKGSIIKEIPEESYNKPK